MEPTVNRIEDLIDERDAGFPLDPSHITLLEAEGVIAWTRIEKMHARMERQAILAALAGTSRVGL